LTFGSTGVREVARIFYSMSGEGRGHATRVRTVVEWLRDAHRITLFAPGDAFDLLSRAYAGSDVAVRRLPGLHFCYDARHRIDTVATVRAGWGFLRRLGTSVDALRQVVERERPDLVITDFEPILPRAARAAGVPLVSLNHQHFLAVSDFRGLPLRLRAWAGAVARLLPAVVSGQSATVVSSFYFPPLKRRYRGRVTQVGVLLRPAVLAAVPTNGAHLVAYLRKAASPQVLAALAHSGEAVRVYGLGERERCDRLEFHAISEERFIADLASARALVTTAGNQLVGEALHLGKPVLAMPEPGNFEQYINAHYLAAEGAGAWVDMEAITGAAVGAFLARLDAYRAAIRPERVSGNAAAFAVLRRHLPGAGDAVPRTAPAARRPAHPLPAYS
jgi:uncharacterized protein (TIGR00661 family)